MAAVLSKRSYKILDRISVLLVVCVVIKSLYSYPTLIENQWGIVTFILWPAVLYLVESCEEYLKYEKISILGKISYEMYLWHVPLIMWISYFCKNLDLANARAMISFVVVAVVVATFNFYFLECNISNFLIKRNGIK